eukprot:1199866-Pyramimonas_sp.AAC.1
MFGVGQSCFPEQNPRNLRNPGHPGGKQGLSGHGSPLCFGGTSRVPPMPRRQLAGSFLDMSAATH